MLSHLPKFCKECSNRNENRSIKSGMINVGAMFRSRASERNQINRLCIIMTLLRVRNVLWRCAEAKQSVDGSKARICIRLTCLYTNSLRSTPSSSAYTMCGWCQDDDYLTNRTVRDYYPNPWCLYAFAFCSAKRIVGWYVKVHPLYLCTITEIPSSAVVDPITTGSYSGNLGFDLWPLQLEF